MVLTASPINLRKQAANLQTPGVAKAKRRVAFSKPMPGKDRYDKGQPQAPKKQPVTPQTALPRPGDAKFAKVDLPDHIDPKTINFTRGKAGEIALSYKTRDGQDCGKYVVTIQPAPEDCETEAVRNAMINLIELTRSKYPAFSQVTFSSEVIGLRGASAEVWVKQGNEDPQAVMLGGYDGTSRIGADDKAMSAKIKRYMEILEMHLRKNGQAWNVAIKAV